MKYIKSFKFWLVFLIVTYTLVGFIMIPWFITNKVPLILKDKIGINLSLGKTSFNPYTYELTLKNITLKDQNQKTAFELKKFYVDYTFFGILTKTFIFNDILIDSAKLYATINKDGNLNLLNIIPKTIKKAEPKATKKSSLPSILLRHMNIANGKILVKDTRNEKNFTANLGPYNFTAHDISTDKGKLNAYTFKTMIDGKSELLWKGGMSISPLKLYGKISIKNLDLPKLYKYALPNIGASLKQGSLSLTLPYQIDMSKKIEARINNAKLTLINIDLNDKKSGKTLINTKNISLNDFNLYWPKQTIFIDSFKIKGTNLYAKLSKDGVINLAKAFKIKSKPSKQEQNTSSFKPWKYILKNAILDDMNVYFNNQQLKVPTKTQISKLSLHVSNISSNKKEPIIYKMTSNLNKKSNISVEGSVIQKPLSTLLHVKLSNIKPTEFINYINPYINFKLKKASIDASVDINANLEDALKLSLGVNTSVNNLLINSQNDKKLLDWKKFTLKEFSLKWPEQIVGIKDISLKGASIEAKLEKNGDINLLKSFIPKTDKKHKITKKSKPWKYLIENANIDKTTVSFLDKTTVMPTKNKLSKISLHVSNISSNKKARIKYKLGLVLNKNSKIKISGSAKQLPLSAKAKVNLANIQISDFENYLTPFVNFKIKKANLNIKANVLVNLQDKPYINLSASTYVKKLQIDTDAGKKLLTWDDLRVNGIKFKTKPMSLTIKDIKLDKPFIVAHVKKDGTTNFSNLVKKSNKTTKTKSNSIKIKIGPMKLTNGLTDYSDDSLPFPFRTLIHDFNGDISTLDFGSTTPSIVKFDGKIDKYGYADIEGVILPFKIKKRANINVLFKNIDLTSLTPYSGKFLGYKIKHGKLSMDLNYKISNASLKGSNKINIDTLDLGDTVKSKDALSLPLGLAIALLKDSNNQIDIDLPVAGDMNNPDFSYGSVIWGAVGHMITGIVTAPFRFLGSLLGIKGDDLKAIDFKGGSFVIISTEQEKLTNLEKIMGKRPNIKLEVNGGYDEFVDTKALQKEQFLALVKSKFAKMKKDTNSSKSDRYGTILKNLYSKEFTLTKYNKLKASFMVVPKVDDNETKVKKGLKKPKQIKKPILNVTAFNDKMQNTLINNIKISKEKLEALANNRAKAIKDTLSTRYKINPKRVKVLKPISQKAKRGKWIGSKITIANMHQT